MNKWYEQAKRKLEAEKGSGSYDRYASAMKGLICEKLCIFCKQDSEFAQAVVQGGPFADCMKAVAKGEQQRPVVGHLQSSHQCYYQQPERYLF